MRILIHATTRVYPYYDGTSLRLFHIIPYLAQKNELHLVQERWLWEDHIDPLSPPGDAEEWLCQYFKSVTEVRHVPGERLKYGFIRESPALYRTLDDLLTATKFDVIYAQNETFPLYVYERRHREPINPLIPPALVGPTDSIHLHYWRKIKILRNPIDIARMLLKWELYIIYQRRVLNRMRYWTMVTDRDAHNMQFLSRNNLITVIPNGVDIAYFSPDGVTRRDPHLITFIGTFGQYSPNEVSIIWFLENVLQEVVSAIPDARFNIVGRRPSLRMVQACSKKNVNLTGYVPDIRPYLWNSGVFVLPMRSGSGIKNKLLEAWAAGCAVISTRLGAEGVMYARDGENIIIVDRPEDMIGEIITTLSSHEQQIRLGEAGQSTAKEYYHWGRIAIHIEDVLSSIAN